MRYILLRRIQFNQIYINGAYPNRDEVSGNSQPQSTDLSPQTSLLLGQHVSWLDGAQPWGPCPGTLDKLLQVLFFPCVSFCCLACWIQRPCISNSFTSFLNRLLVHVLEFWALVNSPAQCNPNQSSLCEMNSVNMESASKFFTPPTQTQALPELPFWIPFALAGKPTASNMLALPPSPFSSVLSQESFDSKSAQQPSFFGHFSSLRSININYKPHILKPLWAY